MDYGFAGAEAYLNTISRLLGGGQSFLGRAVDWVASKRTTVSLLRGILGCDMSYDTSLCAWSAFRPAVWPCKLV